MCWKGLIQGHVNLLHIYILTSGIEENEITEKHGNLFITEVCLLHHTIINFLFLAPVTSHVLVSFFLLLLIKMLPCRGVTIETIVHFSYSPSQTCLFPVRRGHPLHDQVL